MTITRSPGIPIANSGFVAGGGYEGSTEELDGIVSDAAERLAAWSGMDITIRFNSDRKSGSAFLLTNPVDGIGRNCELGVGGAIHSQEWNDESDEIILIDPPTLVVSVLVYPVCLINPTAHEPWTMKYLHPAFDTLDEAFAFVEQHCTVARLKPSDEPQLFQEPG